MGCNCGQKVIHGAIGLTKVVIRKDITTKEVIDQRRNICRYCEHSTKNPKYIDHKCKGLTMFSICKQCDCIISAKTQLATENCPLNKW